MLFRSGDAVCSFHISITDVPVSGDIYSIEVADRGEISFTQEEAKDSINLTLG